MPPKKNNKILKKKTDPVASNSVTQIFSKVEEEEAPEPACLYEDDYCEIKDEEIETDNDTESIISLDSNIENKEDIRCLEDEEYNNSYSFISKVNQNIKIPKDPPINQLTFDEYDDES